VAGVGNSSGHPLPSYYGFAPGAKAHEVLSMVAYCKGALFLLLRLPCSTGREGQEGEGRRAPALTWRGEGVRVKRKMLWNPRHPRPPTPECAGLAGG